MEVNLNLPSIHLYVVSGPAKGIEHKEIKIKNFSYVETCLRNKSKTKKLFFRLSPLSFTYGIKICHKEDEFHVLQRYVNYYNFYANEWRKEFRKKLQNKKDEYVIIRLEADTSSASLKVYIDEKIFAYISDTTVKNRELLQVGDNHADEEKLSEWYTEAVVRPYDFERNFIVRQIPICAISLRELSFRMSEKYLYMRNEREKMVPPPSLHLYIPESVVLKCEIDFRYDPFSLDIWSPYLRIENFKKKQYFPNLTYK